MNDYHDYDGIETTDCNNKVDIGQYIRTCQSTHTVIITPYN